VVTPQKSADLINIAADASNHGLFNLFGAYAEVELERIWPYFEVMFRHFPGWTEIS
jgi:hypothetical protein